MAKNKVFAAMGLTMLIGLALFASGVMARTETASAVLSVSKDKVKAGDTVTVNVAVKQVTDLYGVQFALSYDADKLKLVSSKVSEEYSHFPSSCETCEEGETPVYPLIRKNMNDVGYQPHVKLATFVFEGKQEGAARVELKKLKGVSAETYVTEAGYDDLKTVDILEAKPLEIEVKKGDNGNGNGGE